MVEGAVPMSASRLSILAASACAFLACSTAKTPCLVWNATASAPTGLYIVERAEPLHHGDLVLALPPSFLQRFAAERGYLPQGVPLAKYIAALAGDSVCSASSIITINGHIAARRLAIDSLHRPLPEWTGCRILGRNEVFLLNPAVSHSFDGRYFGPLPITVVLGKLVPLWTP
jgi:conjugative transfer signal peptidase TraF